MEAWRTDAGTVDWVTDSEVIAHRAGLVTADTIPIHRARMLTDGTGESCGTGERYALTSHVITRLVRAA